MRNDGNGSVQSGGLWAHASAGGTRRHASAETIDIRRFMVVVVWSAETIQRTSVTHEPHVAEGVEKVALTMNAPRCVVISHVIETALRARGERALNQTVGVIAEHLDS